MSQGSQTLIQGDDVWVPTVCAGCYNCCSIKVRRINGKVVEAKGDPNAVNSRGHICAKGLVRPLDLYHPARITKPLKRKNPEKGIGIDPRWEEISWDEALDTIALRLREIRSEDPRKLILSHFDIAGYKLSVAFAKAFGTVNYHWNRADYCGSASHPAWLITNGTLNSEVDFTRCKYVVLWGTQLGHMVNTIALTAATELAETRSAGAKLVVVDPFCSHAASKADEWIPLRPGTDGALALAMLRVVVCELGTYDKEFLKHQTNSPYLIESDGRYFRDEATQKPLIRDLSDGKLKTFDDESLKNPAIEGKFEVAGQEVSPAFQVLKDHLAGIDVEEMSRVCGVPLKRIKSFARDFCEAASIGSTIEIEGHTLPYRPAAIDYKRGAAAHKGGLNSSFAIHLLNILVGAIDVPGGQRGVNPVGPFWQPGVSKDGLIIPSDMITKYNKPYPGRKAQIPQTLDLQELFPAALFTRGLFPLGIDDPERFGIPYQAEAMIHGRANLMMNSHDPKAMAHTLKRLEFQVSICNHIDETSEFADIVLPDSHDYERWDMFPANDPYAFVSPGCSSSFHSRCEGSWYFLLRQPVVEPPEGVLPWTEIYLELADRLDILEDLFQVGNEIWGLDAEHKLEKGTRYTLRDIAERQAKSLFGDDFHLDRYSQSSSLDLRKKTVQEAFPRMFLPSRIPVYLEYLLDHKKDVQEVVDALGIEWDVTPYSPVPLWIPCESQKQDGEYDLIATNCKLPTHQFSITTENLWIDEIAKANPYAYKIMIHTSSARKRGLVTGDTVCVESRYGKCTGKLKVTELVYPECVVACGTFGHWAKGMPVSANKGVLHNALLPKPNLDRIDTLSGQVDMCVRVKVYKVEE